MGRKSIIFEKRGLLRVRGIQRIEDYYNLDSPIITKKEKGKSILVNDGRLDATRNVKIRGNTSLCIVGGLEFDNNGCMHNTYSEKIMERIDLKGIEVTTELNETEKEMYCNDDYNDFGDCTYYCIFCNANMWYEERSPKKQKENPPRFPTCCSNGKIRIPNLKEPPLTLRNLIYKNDEKSKHLMKNIRAYNMMFSLTSMGGKIDMSINNGGAPFVFRLNGANYHQIGSMLPHQEVHPRFSQLYIYDIENEVPNRINALSGKDKDGSKKLDQQIVEDLRVMIDEFNPFAMKFRNARERIETGDENSFEMRLIEKRKGDGRTHNLPTASEVAALIPCDIDKNMEKRDVVLQLRDGFLQRISELHPCYVPLQYPLFFPYGEDGYRLGIVHSDAESTARKRTRLSMREFFAFRIHEHLGKANTIFYSKRLFQHFFVDSFTRIESERMCYVRNNQGTLRTDKWCDLKDAADRGKIETSTAGKKIIPSSYTGGPRYMIQNFQDAMSILRFLEKRGLGSEDRPDILCRLFKMKLDRMIKDLKDIMLFGKVDAMIYTVEFQKRGLPHAHILLFLSRANKIPHPEDVDKIISAEIPNKESHSKIHELVLNYMIHGPPKLLLRFEAHINVKWCNQHKSIKYMFKYVNKGPNRVMTTVVKSGDGESNSKAKDEIDTYFNYRYISPCEAVWRTLGFDIHYRIPTV
ncbi:hypothetical protein ACS0TY_026907 [Phlomoides rotata]